MRTAGDRQGAHPAPPQDEAQPVDLVDLSVAPPLVRRTPSVHARGSVTGSGSGRASGWRRAAALLASALAVAAVATPVVVVSRVPAERSRRPASDAPPSRAAPAASGGQLDVDGDGRTERVTIDGSSIVVESGPREGRYRIGEPSGIVFVADADCDGIATPVVHRPADGQVFVFPEWPDAGSVAPQVLDVPAGGTLEVTRTDSCDVLQVGGLPVG